MCDFILCFYCELPRIVFQKTIEELDILRAGAGIGARERERSTIGTGNIPQSNYQKGPQVHKKKKVRIAHISAESCWEMSFSVDTALVSIRQFMMSAPQTMSAEA